jgi:1-aminocyclopropane-1-carboxylate deaminase/D-cysteine desulfhydrase-like pyridoxal-dependent ACC family enzyme
LADTHLQFILPSPIQPICLDAAQELNIQVYLKREDLIHPLLPGNKWRKLKYNLEEAHTQEKQTILTFGGAYSNHIYSVAAAGKLFGFHTIGLIRGEAITPLNATLSFAKNCGMELHYVDRATYRHKEDFAYQEGLRQKYGDFYLIPEGGSNALAVKGCAEIPEEIHEPYDYLCCPCGTGGTLAGLVAGAAGYGKIMGFAALKGGAFLAAEVQQLLASYTQLRGKTCDFHNYQIQTDYHFGGYAKVKPALLDFIRKFEQANSILLEQVYTGKMLFGIEDLIKKGFFASGTKIIALHTGGLQGRTDKL